MNLSSGFRSRAGLAAVVAGLLVAFALQGVWHARVKSATFDEPVHIAAALLTVKGLDPFYAVSHPPLLRYLSGIFLQAAHPAMPANVPRTTPETLYTISSHLARTEFAQTLVYRNQISAERILFAARMATVFLGVLLGALVFFWSQRIHGTGGGLLSLVLFAFCPTLIAHGSLATTDMGGAACGVFFLFALTCWMRRPDVLTAGGVGAALGLAILAKLSNPLLAAAIPAAGVSLALGSRKRSRLACKGILVAFLAAWFVVAAGYRFEGLFQTHHLPRTVPERTFSYELADRAIRHLPLPDSFVQGIGLMMQHASGADASYLLGQNYEKGRWDYFPVAFAVKTPTVTLVVILLSLLSLPLRRVENGSEGSAGGTGQDEAVLLAGAVLFFSIAVFSGINLGVRHILICYPLLYVLAGRLVPLCAERLPRWGRHRTVALTVLVGALLGGEVLSVAPDYLAFFNRLAGGPRAGIRYLADSNLDWGQDLGGLAEYLRRQGNPELMLSYFGTAPPQYYGIVYQELLPVVAVEAEPHVNSPRPAREYLAVSATNVVGVYFDGYYDLRWLLRKKALAVVGHSIFVYDVTDDLDAQVRILEIYRARGEAAKVSRQVERVRRLGG